MVKKPLTSPSTSATSPGWVRTASAHSRIPSSSPNQSGSDATIASQAAPSLWVEWSDHGWTIPLRSSASPSIRRQRTTKTRQERSIARRGARPLGGPVSSTNRNAVTTDVGSTISADADSYQGSSFRQLAALPHLPNLCTWPPSRPREWDIRIIGAVDRSLDLDKFLDLKPARDEQPNHVSMPDAELDVPDGAVWSVQLESVHAEVVPMKFGVRRRLVVIRRIAEQHEGRGRLQDQAPTRAHDPQMPQEFTGTGRTRALRRIGRSRSRSSRPRTGQVRHPRAPAGSVDRTPPGTSALSRAGSRSCPSRAPVRRAASTMLRGRPFRSPARRHRALKRQAIRRALTPDSLCPIQVPAVPTLLSALEVCRLLLPRTSVHGRSRGHAGTMLRCARSAEPSCVAERAGARAAAFTNSRGLPRRTGRGEFGA